MKVKLTGDIFAEYDKAHKVISDKIKKEIVANLKEATPVDTGEARDSWASDANGVYNTADHIIDLNRGSSQKAPAHFVERAILSVNGVKPNGIVVREV